MEDEEGWDGPNIRPPQVKQQSRSGSRVRESDHYRSRYRQHLSTSNRRSSRDSSRSGSVRDRDGRQYNRSSDARSGGSSRRVDSSRSSRPASERRYESDRRVERRRISSINKSRRHRDQRRRQHEQHRTRRESGDRDEPEKRKRRRSASRGDNNRKSMKREEEKSETEAEKITKNEKPDPANENVAESGESDSGSSSEASSSDEESSGTSSEGSDETDSEESQATPEVKDSDAEADGKPAEEVVDEGERSHEEKSPGEISATSRTPSRSPTPRRTWTQDEDDEEELEREQEQLQQQQRDQQSSERGSDYEGLHEDHDDEAEEEPEAEVENVLEELPPYLPSIYGCRKMDEFELLNKIEEGTFGVVYRALEKRTKEVVALKRLKMEREKDGFPITSLREINTLLIAQHPNVVTVREIVCGDAMDSIYIVMDFVEHDLKSLMETMRSKQQVFLPSEIKCLMIQLLRAIAHLHDNWILHRDLKASNILLSHNGIIKVGDFGLAREYGSPLKSYTSVVVTLWYRSPELLLGIKEYSTYVDVWSIGCIFGELLQMSPLFRGESEPNQIALIFGLLGSPTEEIWPGVSKLPVVQRTGGIPEYPGKNLRTKFTREMLSDVGLKLFKDFLTYDPSKRISCEEALRDAYFREHPLPIDPSMFPTWPAKSEMSSKSAVQQQLHLKRGFSPRAPSGGGAFKKLQDEDRDYGGFILNAGKSAPAPWNLKF